MKQKPTALAAAVRSAAAFAWRMVKLLLWRTLQVALALIVLFEEWGWRPLADLLARFARWQPWARLEAGIAALPSYLALAVFALPTALFFPLKLLALYLIAKGHAVMAALLFAAAKVFGTALIARIFQLTKPALMRIPWFAYAYAVFMPWKEAVFAWVRASWPWRYGRLVKARIKRLTAAAWAQAKPRLVAAAAELRQQVRILFGQSRT